MVFVLFSRSARKHRGAPSVPGRREPRSGHLLQPRSLVAGLAVATLAVAGCSDSHHRSSGAPVIVGGSSAPAGRFDGDQLNPPLTLSAADLSAPFRASSGATTTLARLGQGKLMLLYFGYTDCPDVCPTTMADVGQALKRVPGQSQFHTQVVFVTSDPAHDTPAVMKTWLANFDPGLPLPFIGLTASIKQIDDVAKSLGVPLNPPVTNPDGSISVQHGAQTMAFIGGKARLMWLAGTAPARYAHDITTLLDSDPPS